jgi:hypothetical protein
MAGLSVLSRVQVFVSRAACVSMIKGCVGIGPTRNQQVNSLDVDNVPYDDEDFADLGNGQLDGE